MATNTINIRQKMDTLSIRSLELMDEIIKERRLLDKHLKEAFINMAKSRYNIGNKFVGISQLPNEEKGIEPLFKVSAKEEEGNFKEFNLISMTKSDKICEENEEESSVVRQRGKNSMKEFEARKEKNPLNWFGILVPSTLRQSQTGFQNSLGILCKIATMQSELKSVCAEFRRLKIEKNNDEMNKI